MAAIYKKLCLAMTGSLYFCAPKNLSNEETIDLPAIGNNEPLADRPVRQIR
jgi:hypothetical protein